MLEDGIFSVRFLCAEMCMQPHSWALCDAGSAASADYPVALTCASTLASFAAFRDGQKETAGQLLGFSLCCVRAESTGDHRDVATRNANVALRDGDSWLSRGSIKATAYGRVGGRSYLGEGQPKWPVGEGCRFRSCSEWRSFFFCLGVVGRGTRLSLHRRRVLLAGRASVGAFSTRDDRGGRSFT